MVVICVRGLSDQVVVRFVDSASSPYDVRLTRARSNATGGPGGYVGAHRRPSISRSKIDAPAVADFAASAGGGILIAIAIAGSLLIVVYVGRSAALATASLSGTPLASDRFSRVNVLRPTRRQISHFRDSLVSRSLGVEVQPNATKSNNKKLDARQSLSVAHPLIPCPPVNYC